MLKIIVNFYICITKKKRFFENYTIVDLCIEMNFSWMKLKLGVCLKFLLVYIDIYIICYNLRIGF